MEESGENTESDNTGEDEAAALAITREQENERYFEILQNYELERLQKAEEQLKRDIDLAKKLSLEIDELEDVMSNGNDETQVMTVVESSHVNRRSSTTTDDRNTSAQQSSNQDEDDDSHEVKVLMERDIIQKRRSLDRQRGRNMSNRGNTGDGAGRDEDISVAEPQSVSQDEEDYAHELKVLQERGILPPDYSLSHTVNGHHSPQPRRRNLQRDNTEDAQLLDDSTAIEFEDFEVFPNGMVMDFLNPYPFDSEGIPKNWNKSNIPPSGSNELYRLTQLYPGQDEYETIATDFCLSDLEVVKIERLQSPTLLGRFRGEQDHLLKTRPSGFQLNLRYLYHGTTCDKLRVCEEGLDARLGMTGCFGRGIYFSDKPKKCVQYAGRDVGHHGRFPFILMCRVILGHAKNYPKGQMDRTLKREPEKESASGGWRFYDSVKGCPIDFNEFVIYENRRAMIEYIITFKTASKPFEDQATVSNFVTPPVLVPPAASSIPSVTSTNDDDDDNDGTSASGRTVINDDSDDEDEFARFYMSPEMWEHMKRIEIVRESVRQKRALEKGEVYVGPTREQKRKDRIMWRKVLRINNPVGSEGYETVPGIKPGPPTKSQETFASLNRNNNESGQESEPSHDEPSNEEDEAVPTDEDLESIKKVESLLITDFLSITQTEDTSTALLCLERCAMNLDQAIALYFEEKT